MWIQHVKKAKRTVAQHIGYPFPRNVAGPSGVLEGDLDWTEAAPRRSTGYPYGIPTTYRETRAFQPTTAMDQLMAEASVGFTSQ